MAEVAIPVVVDIEGAFRDAASRVDMAMQPLKAAIEKSTADLKLNVSPIGAEKEFRTLASILNTVRETVGSTNFAFDHLVNALDDAKNRLNELYTIGAKRGGLTADQEMLASELQKSIVLLESEIDLRTRAGNLASEEAKKQIAVSRAIADGDAALLKEANTINELSNKISALRGKLVNLNPEKDAETWEATAKEIREATKQLTKYQKAYDALVNPPKRKATPEAGSIDRITRDMQKLEQQWNKMGAKVKFDADGQLSEKAKKLVKDYQNLTEQSEKYGQSLSKAASTAKPALDQTTNAMKSQSKVLQQLTSYAKMYVSVFGVFRLAKQIRDVTAELEYQRVALGHLIQDEEYGAKLFEQIKAAAIESPFRITQLVTYTKQLAAYRIEQEKLFDTTRRLADISAGLGVDMNRLILAYGQVRAASVLRGQELRQFTEAGIPLVELLAEKFRELGREGTTTADVFKLISERAVPFSMIADIFEDLTDKGGMFYEMQKEQAQTLKGRWEKLKDTYDIALQSIGETKTFENMNNVILGTLKFLANNIRILPKLLEAVTRGWLAYNAAVAISNLNTKKAITHEIALAASQNAEATRISRLTVSVLGEAKARDLLTKAYVKQKVATTALGRSFAKLTAAMISNPIGALLAGVAALTGLFFTFRKSVDSTSNSLDYLDNAIESISKANTEFEKSGKLIARYEKLASKTEKTAAENQKLYTTIEQLRDIFPELSREINNENRSLEEQVGLLEEARKKRQEQARLEAEGSYKTAKKDLEDALALQEDLEHKYQQAFSSQQAFEEAGNKALERRWRKQTEQRKKELDEVRDKVQKLYTDIGSLEKYLFPEEAMAKLAEWQKLLVNASKYTSEGVTKELFDGTDVEGWESLGEAIKKLRPQFKEAKETYEGLVSAVKEGGKLVRPELMKNRDAAKDTYDAWLLLDTLLGGLLSKASSIGGSYQQDPFINLMQDRIKFMQDFKKGYDDLNKHMSSNDALYKQSGIMEARGMSLGINPREQTRAANDLSKWYADAIEEAFKEAKKHGATGGNVEDFLRQQIKDTSNRGKALRDFQKLIQSLWDAKTDFDTSKLKKDLEDAMKRLTEDIKRSETVRNFYKNILDLTGDEDLAATMSVSVYGGIGNDFKENLQRQLNAALLSLDPSKINDNLIQAFSTMDFNTILKNIDKFNEDQQKVLRELASSYEKYNADIATDLLKSLQDAKTYSEKRVELAMQTSKRLEQINEMNVSDSIKNQLRKQNVKKESEEAAKLAYEAFKDTPMYVELFANLDRASTRMLHNMRDNLIAMKSNWKDLDPTDLKELQSRLKEIDEQLARKNPFSALIDSIKEYNALTKNQSRREVDDAADSLTKYAILQRELLNLAAEEYEAARDQYGVGSEQERQAKDILDVQRDETEQAEDMAKAAQETANAYRNAQQHILDAAEGLKEWQKYITDSLEGIGEIVSTFGSSDLVETFNIISEGIGKTLGGMATTAGSVARILAGDLTAIPALIQGIGETISGIFGTWKELKINRINKQIEYQQDLIDSLEYDYGRLEKAIEKAFGSDYIYNYNKQLENLAAQQAAYQKQADLERDKGKKADEEKIKEYENSARDAADQIADMGSQLSEFFAGTDLSSAAQDFANSWIEAYKEFGSTTDAMKEKFQDMVQSMIEQSLGAKIMQSILQPLFDSIDEMAQSGGELTAQEIAQIGQMAPEYIDQINNAMTGLMNSLAASGYNVRQQMGSLTGISRDIAGASEESINGLAAGINTQNFYMSLISQNVAAILQTMTGGEVQGATGVAVPDTYKETMMGYAMHIPTISEDIAAIKSMLSDVIKQPGAPVTKYVYTYMR